MKIKNDICTECGQNEEIVKVVEPSTLTFDDGYEIEIEGCKLCHTCNDFKNEEMRIMLADAMVEHLATA
jgi:hypothetical protein